MKKPFATEVIVTEHGLVVVGRREPRTRVWFKPAKKSRLSERLEEFTLPFEAPRGSPAALLPSGRLLVVGRKGESVTVELERSPQPGPVLPNVLLEGLSPDGVAFARGPRFFRYVDGAWRDESPDEAGDTGVSALDEGLAVGSGGEAWAAPSWKRVATKTKAELRCVSGRWIGGAGVVLERTAKGFKQHTVDGRVTSLCAWKKSALMVIDGALFDLSGAPVKAPPQLSSVGAHEGVLYCVSKGALFESTDARAWHRKALPK